VPWAHAATGMRVRGIYLYVAGRGLLFASRSFRLGVRSSGYGYPLVNFISGLVFAVRRTWRVPGQVLLRSSLVRAAPGLASLIRSTLRCSPAAAVTSCRGYMSRSLVRSLTWTHIGRGVIHSGNLQNSAQDKSCSIRSRPFDAERAERREWLAACRGSGRQQEREPDDIVQSARV